jgi:hypothetical protein
MSRHQLQVTGRADLVTWDLPENAGDDVAAGVGWSVAGRPITWQMVSPPPRDLTARRVVTADLFPTVIHRSDQLSTGGGGRADQKRGGLTPLC